MSDAGASHHASSVASQLSCKHLDQVLGRTPSYLELLGFFGNSVLCVARGAYPRILATAMIRIHLANRYGFDACACAIPSSAYHGTFAGGATGG